MQVRDLTAALESLAPLNYQESYDNSGLHTGTPDQEITGILVTLDVTEAVLDEAKQRGCSCIVSHHPLIFSGLKKLSGNSLVERIVRRAIKEDIALYAIHTNLDNMRGGVNAEFSAALGLEATAILQPKTDTLRKLYTYVPHSHADRVRNALFAEGAGDIGRYRECSFSSRGTGTFKPDADADPLIGEAGGLRELVDEVKVEVLVQRHKEARILQALFDSHPYEEVAFEFIHLHNANQEIGAGMIGTLPEPMDERAFLALLREKLGAQGIRHTALLNKPISKVAVCGGSGQFLLPHAIASGADAFVTSDFKYHQFFDADGRILIADVGHYESEIRTVDLLTRFLTEKFPNFAVLKTGIITNPVHLFHP